jgi:GNAT superfamily N-acetyltransferase
MKFEISEAPIAEVGKLAAVPISFTVERIFHVGPRDNATGDYQLSEHATAAPFRKNYDKIRGESPAEWARRFDVTNWGFIQARAEGTRIGGAVIAWKSPEVRLLEDRDDLALLWNIRVAPAARRQGVGTALFRAAEAWAAARGCRELKVETQNINVPAGRFYARMGCTLRGVDRLAYKILPDEIQLLWYKNLVS